MPLIVRDDGDRIKVVASSNAHMGGIVRSVGSAGPVGAVALGQEGLPGVLKGLNLEPERHRDLVAQVERRFVPAVHVRAAVELQRAADLALHPFWIADDRAVVPLATRIFGRRTARFIELPMSHQAGRSIAAQYGNQRGQQPKTHKPNVVTHNTSSFIAWYRRDEGPKCGGARPGSLADPLLRYPPPPGVKHRKTPTHGRRQYLSLVWRVTSTRPGFRTPFLTVHTDMAPYAPATRRPPRSDTSCLADDES